jgi:hypothetical protein
MQKEITYEFPSGVLTGAPFTDVESGVLWLVQADENQYPGIAFNNYWSDPARLVPVLVTTPTEVIYIDPQDDTALRQAWADWDNDHHSEERYPLDYPRMDASLRPAGLDHLILESYLDHYRALQGIADYLRRSLPQAKQRRDVAKQLYEIEPAIDRTAVTLLRLINTHVCEMWREAIMHGEITDPPNPHAPKPTTNNPAGIARLNG